MTDEVRLTSGDAAVVVTPAAGGRIASLTVGGVELLVSGPGRGVFPMAPWCGRIDGGVLHLGSGDVQLPRNHGPHAIHGTARDGGWEVLDSSADSLTMAYELAAPWPFPGRVIQELSLAPSHLDLTMTVSTSKDPFPAQAGWHPWFRKYLAEGAAPVQLGFQAAWQEERGDDMIPTGERIPVRPGPWDDCFGMPGGVKVSLTWPEKLRLVLTSSAEWVVIYDEKPDAACVEPQTGPPNGSNTAPVVVTPAQPLVIRTRWAWTAVA